MIRYEPKQQPTLAVGACPAVTVYKAIRQAVNPPRHVVTKAPPASPKAKSGRGR